MIEWNSLTFLINRYQKYKNLVSDRFQCNDPKTIKILWHCYYFIFIIILGKASNSEIYSKVRAFFEPFED